MASPASVLSMVVSYDMLCIRFDTWTPAFLLFLAPSRRRRRRVSPKTQELRDAAIFSASDDEDGFSCAGNGDVADDAPSLKRSGCEDASYDERDYGVAETDLDEELRIALMSTPMDMPTHRFSQCEIMQQPVVLLAVVRQLLAVAVFVVFVMSLAVKFTSARNERDALRYKHFSRAGRVSLVQCCFFSMSSPLCKAASTNSHNCKPHHSSSNTCVLPTTPRPRPHLHWWQMITAVFRCSAHFAAAPPDR